MSRKTVVRTVEEEDITYVCDMDGCEAEAVFRCNLCEKDFCSAHASDGSYCGSQYGMDGNWACDSCLKKGADAMKQIDDALATRDKEIEAARQLWRKLCKEE